MTSWRRDNRDNFVKAADKYAPVEIVDDDAPKVPLKRSIAMQGSASLGCTAGGAR